MGYDPDSMITRRHFHSYKPGCAGNPPPLHVVSMNPDANHWPLPRPLEAGGQPGPALVCGDTGSGNLGIDPTDPATWGSRGYRPSTGMIGRFNTAHDYPTVEASGVRPA
jgi:hypothetical protein